MANHPDSVFELLCDIDLMGATITPLGTADKPFAGEIKGRNLTLSNFTLQGGADGWMGMTVGTVKANFSWVRCMC